MHVTPAPATTRPTAADRRRRRPSRRELAAIVLGVATLASALVITADVDAPVAEADGTPNITFTKTADTRTLIGATTSVSLRACNPTGTNGYNLSFRDVIPAGLSMVNPNPAPTRTVANQPNAGETTVIWENVSDLLAGSCTSIGYGIDTNPDNNLSTNQVGSSFATTGGAYVSDVAFDVPDFDVNGQPTGTHGDGYATGTTAGTTIAAFIAEKDSGDAGEGELLRGVHGSEPKIYTLRVRNNPEAATNAFTITDVLPPSLEFLGCAYIGFSAYASGSDNTTDAPTNPSGGVEEYTGSGRLASSPLTATCFTPATITTLAGGSTQVVWDSASLGGSANLAANAVLEITYLAGIPLRENTTTWTGATPSAASLGQGRNLDNNSGAPTSESATEGDVTNSLSATGVFQGPSTTGTNPVLTDQTQSTNTAEDLVIRKSMSGQVIQGTVVTTTLTIQTGEYRDTTSLVVTDTLPDGLCPIASSAIDVDCGIGADPTINTGSGPVTAPFTSATENADGTWTLVWDAPTVAGLASLAHSSTITMTFQSRVRTHYQENFDNEVGRPVLNFDSLTNDVEIQALDFRRDPDIDAVDGDLEPDAELDFDVSQATIDGIGPTIDKRVSTYTDALDAGSGVTAGTVGDLCQAGTGITWVDGPSSNPVTGFGPGDYVCFDLRANFPAFIDADGVEIQDLLPAQFEYVTGSARRVTTGGSADTLAGTTVSEDTSGANDIVTFVVDGDSQVPSAPSGQQFHWTIAARMLDPNLSAAYDINANLMKMTTRNTAGTVFQYRDESTVVWTEPQVHLDKTNGTSGDVVAGNTVTYTIRIWNDGNIAADDLEVWDRLPTGIQCADVVSLGGATCASDILVWDATDVPTVAEDTTLGTAPVTLTYQVLVPTTVDPDRVYVNTAGVRRYQASTNADDTPYVYYPATNIDPTVTPNTTAAHDTSQITIRPVLTGKVQQSSVNETGNPANGSPDITAERATIGETVTYTITATIPEGTTVVDARLQDALNGNLVLHATPTWTFNSVVDDPAWTLTAPAIGAGGTVRLDRSGSYTNAPSSGDDTLVLTIVARVASGVAGNTITNQGQFSYLPDPAIGTTRVNVNSTTISTTIVEPAITMTKNENDADDIVSPGDSLTYTLTVNATSGTNRSPAHDLVIVDTIPAGLTVKNGGVDVLDGGTVNPDGGIWNQTARTITWDVTTTAGKLSTINAGSNTTLSYAVEVDDPAVSGSIFTNNVTAAASSMLGAITGERTTYSANATDTVTAPQATIAKSVSPANATIGDTVTYTVDVTVPAGITTYDLTVLDTLPDGVDFQNFGTFTYTGTSTGCPSLAGAQGIAGQTNNGDGSTTVGFFVDDFASPSTNSCVIRMTYTAWIDDTYVPEGTPVVAGNTLINSARAYWNQLNSVSSVPATPPAPGGFTRNAGPATATVTVREPSVRIDKDVSQTPCDATPGNVGDADNCNTDIGSSYTYTLTVTNSSTTWAAHDISVVDAPDGDLVNVVVPASAGPITVVDGTAPNLEWLISTIAPSSSVTITYTADLAASAALNDGEQILNVADVPTYYGASEATRLADGLASWRSYGQGGVGGDVTADSVVMTVGFPHVTIDKSAISDATDARVGVPFTWRLLATNHATEPTAAAYDVDLDDDLPAGWVYSAGSASVVTPYGTTSVEPICSPDCSTAGATLRWSDVVSGLGQPLQPGATIRIDFAAVPQSSLLAVGTTGTANPHTNTGGVPDAEDVTGATSNLDGDYTGPDDTASAVIRRTDLSVTKVPSAGPYSFGSEINWTITVANAGPDTATGVTVLDQLPVGLVYVTTVSATQGSYDDGTGIWTVGTIANGNSATLVVRTRLNQIGAITNRAEVQASNQWDVDSTPNSQLAVADEDDDDTATITAVSTSLGDYVWYDVDGDATADVGEPGIPGVTVTLESAGLDNVFGTTDDFFGPDGVSGGGDDITVTSVVTNATGFYGFSNLPTGDYRVRVDHTTLPAGMAPTYNDDVTIDHLSSTITLNSSTGYLLADFGYTGTGSLGDTIWLDVDASGGATRDPGEPGIPAIDVTLVWGGFDGDLSTTSDNVSYPVDTTDGSGQYLFTLLPAGPYRLDADGADIPAGTTPTYDLDGTASANRVTTSLAAGQHRTDVDLSYTGNGSIGDTIWYDRDGDGVLDGDETGLAGIDVTVVWFGADGVAGGGDDVTFTTTTSAGGTYLVDHLPAGNYTVTIDHTDLPAGMVPTHDLDGTGTAHTTTATLSDGQDRVDADFGYRGVASVGDHVWYDLDGDGSASPEPGEPGLANVPVTVVWAGPDATFGNADDVTIVTTTDANGDYLVDHLPYGPVRVTLDPADLPGFEATYDGDGLGTAHRVDVVLAVDDPMTVGVDEANVMSADFSYTGTGSLGDLVWQDVDADGTRNGAETGFSGVDVTVTWAGLDGVAGTADDVVFATATGTDGDYLVERLPAGGYTVVVDTADLPAGMVSVSEPDAVRDSRTSTTLAAGQDRTDADFGYRLQADLSIDKSHTGRFEVDRNGVYTMAIRNAGPAAAATPRVTDVLPTGLGFVSATTATTGVTCAASGQTVTCDLPTMAVDDSITITLTVSVARTAAPGVTNTASVVSVTHDPVTTNNTDSDPTEVPLADLQLAKRLDGTLVRNSTVTYVLDATNLGPSPSSSAVVITDTLPEGLTFVDATGTGVTCTAEGQVVRCVTAGPMAVGATVSVSVRVRVTAASGTTIVNSATVGESESSAPADPVLVNNDASTPATTVSTNLPVTGWALMARWLQIAGIALGLGALVVVLARRRRPSLG